MSEMHIDYDGLQGLVDEGRQKTERKKERKRRRKGRVGRALRRGAFGLTLAVLLVVLPFALLIRVGLYAFAAGAGGWTSVAVGLLAVTVLLSGYAWFVGRRFGAGPKMRAFLRRGAVAVGALYVGYALTFVAGGNVSTPDVRAEYRELHPLLRVAASTVFLADGGRVMTDASRTPEDYWLMGLPVNEASLHFPQETGYVHALDLRTRGRKEWSNRLVEGFFWVMGFHALRHVGTADHLHVSLRIPEG